MAKFNMKDYEDYLEEEKRQDRLQEDLEDKRMEEAHDAEENWQDYQRAQEEERRLDEMMEEYPDYDWDDWDDDDLEDYADLLDVDDLDDDEDDGDYPVYIPELVTEDIVLEQHIVKKSLERNQQEDRICRKSVARNRYLNEIKAQKRAQQSATILESKYRTSKVGTDYEEFRLYSRSTAAAKKVARVKTA